MDENRIWNLLGRDLGSPLTEAIEKEMPERGKIGSRYPWPNLYPMALLRGVIAAASAKNDGTRSLNVVTGGSARVDRGCGR